MRWVFVIAAGIAATGSASAMECGVFTDSAHAPGKVVAELGADAMTIRAAPDFEYRYVLEPQKAERTIARDGRTTTSEVSASEKTVTTSCWRSANDGGRGWECSVRQRNDLPQGRLRAVCPAT